MYTRRVDGASVAAIHGIHELLAHSFHIQQGRDEVGLVGGPGEERRANEAEDAQRETDSRGFMQAVELQLKAL